MDHFLTHGRPPSNKQQQQQRYHRYYDYILYIDMDVVIMDLNRWDDWQFSFSKTSPAPTFLIVIDLTIDPS